MNTYIVSYDVNVTKSGSYDKFYEYLERRGEKNYQALTESTYLILSKLDLDVFIKKMKQCFNKGDNVYVIAAEDKDKLNINKLY